MSLIELSHVDLEYPIREHQRATLKEFILKGLFREKNNKRRTIRALTDISLRVQTGERVGIIGFNGAGKSTLLRTIGGIYPLARGTRHVEGSICSLFDITLGFEMEANAWDNIYYRCFVQGESPGEIKAKLQSIGEFSELGEFLNLPLRCYSTGMVMRLAFSIATSANPEILLIDEVFATGDLAFKKKAEERMKDLLHRAQIVIMVGHDLGFLRDFCTRVLWMHQGKIRQDGPAPQVVQAYIDEARNVGRAA
jgi:ABC-type polysaccharide/polyol phosphate transport system ATPase subunit